MSEDPNVVSKAALLQSITTEASGFYGQIVTVASAFLGGSLLFMEKIAPVRVGFSLLFLAFGWLALVASIGCVARLRHMNLMAGGLAMDGNYEKATNQQEYGSTLGLVSGAVDSWDGFSGDRRSFERRSIPTHRKEPSDE